MQKDHQQVLRDKCGLTEVFSSSRAAGFLPLRGVQEIIRQDWFIFALRPRLGKGQEALIAVPGL